MKIEIVIPQRIVQRFIDDYEEIHSIAPVSKQIERFFKLDIMRVYVQMADDEGFLDAI